MFMDSICKLIIANVKLFNLPEKRIMSVCMYVTKIWIWFIPLSPHTQ